LEVRVVVRVLIRLVVLAVAIWLTTWILPGVDVNGGVLTYLWVALLFGLVNAFIGPVLRLVALPFTIITLGLFALVVNAALLGITAALTDRLEVDGFWMAVLAALSISIFSAVLSYFVPEPKRS